MSVHQTNDAVCQLRALYHRPQAGARFGRPAGEGAGRWVGYGVPTVPSVGKVPWLQRGVLLRFEAVLVGDVVAGGEAEGVGVAGPAFVGVVSSTFRREHLPCPLILLHFQAAGAGLYAGAAIIGAPGDVHVGAVHQRGQGEGGRLGATGGAKEKPPKAIYFGGFNILRVSGCARQGCRFRPPSADCGPLDYMEDQRCVLSFVAGLSAVLRWCSISWARSSTVGSPSQ